MAYKICSHCEKEKSLKDFKKNKDGKLGRYSLCKDCQSNRDKTRYTNGDSYAVRLKKLYGLSSDEYEQLYLEAEGKCQSCGVKEVELSRRLAVDHCHNSGIVRGLLCGKCNTALGQLDDNLEKIASLYSYLKERKW